MTMQDLLVSTTFEIPGYKITKSCGIVRGLVVRSPTIAQGIIGGLKSIIGGQIVSYREMCESARTEAYQEMIEHAQSMGANAIVGMRYDSSELGGNSSRATEILCYGTAVTVQAE
jgi:uncharacterized protein YbjQ (UPF0145 family)